MMKKFVILILVALIHFAASIAIIAISMAAAPVVKQGQATLEFQVLVVATRILHFPIISLSWYSRQWFPGDWIYVPIALNSLMWAVVLVVCYILVYKIRGSRRHGK
jgi:hypothetical protein